MVLTVFLAIVFCAAMALMLISAVAFIQDNGRSWAWSLVDSEIRRV